MSGQLAASPSDLETFERASIHIGKGGEVDSAQQGVRSGSRRRQDPVEQDQAFDVLAGAASTGTWSRREGSHMNTRFAAPKIWHQWNWQTF